jgi:NADPH:quinone reductase
MRAIVIKDGKLELSEVKTPEPGPGYARVRIRACGVNRADLLQRYGLYPAPPDAPPDTPGLELAGEVDAIGGGVHGDVKVGDRVFGIVGGGAYAEYVTVHARTLAPIPTVNGKPLSFEEAAAIPEAFLTAYDAMVLQCGLSAGQTVLVHAAGSGVGTAAVQIAKAVGARSIGTARSKDKLTRAESLGMNAGVVTEANADGTPKFAERVRSLTKGERGVDVVLELVGGNYIPESLSALTDQGSLVLVGLMAGIRADIDLSMVLRKRLHIIGTVLRSRPLEEKIVAGQVLRRHISPLIEEGKLAAIVDKVFPLAEAGAALDHMQANASFGKIVLSI